MQEPLVLRQHRFWIQRRWRDDCHNVWVAVYAGSAFVFNFEITTGIGGRHLTMKTDVRPENSSSGRKIAIGAMASGAVNIIKVILQLLLLPVMARLLGPSEFGLYALALPTVSLVALLADGGLGGTLAREHESASLVWSTAFWALLVIGAILALGSSIFGVFLGYIAQQPRLPGMIALLSLSLVFLTLSVVPSARLSRRKNLGVGAGADLVSNLVGAIIAVAMAWHGAGAWSLVAQYVAVYAVRAVILNFAAFQLPETTFSLEALRPHLVSGGILIASRICEYGGRVTENFLIDRIFGTVILGSYSFATQISKFAGEAAGNVVWAALYVQALTGDKDKIVILHRKLCRLLGLVLFPTMFLAAAAAPELISLTLGPKWTDLSLFLRIFLPLHSFTVVCSQTAPILLAYGRFDIQFWCIVGLTFGRVLAVVLGLWIGLTGALCGIALVTLLFSIAMLVFPAKATGCRPLPVLAGLFYPTIASVLAAVAYLTVIGFFPMSMIWTLTSLAAGLLVYALSMAFLDWKDLAGDWSTIRSIALTRRTT
jgi:PST family polysaccharide transporter